MINPLPDTPTVHPMRRVHMPTAQGKTRPIGLSAFEDEVRARGGRRRGALGNPPGGAHVKSGFDCPILPAATNPTSSRPNCWRLPAWMTSLTFTGAPFVW
jgi:hypothetical protein